MPLTVIGVSHDTAPVEVRERLSIPAAELSAVLDRLREHAAECVLLSTCNRFEVYALPREQESFGHVALDLMGVGAGELEAHIYTQEGAHAAGHLFRVAAGVQSAIVGEVQILGQVQRAWQAAHQAGTAGPVLSQLFHKAVALGKRVRSETSVDRRPASVSYAAVALARQIFGPDLSNRQVLLIGTGEVGEGVARCLYEHGLRPTVVAHRRLERAYAIAGRYHADVALWEAMPEHLAATDIVISSTAAPHTILQRQQVERAMTGRPDRPLYMIDLAVPRDIDPAVAELPGVHLHNIDDLQAVVRATLEERRSALPQIEAMVDAEVERFSNWLRVRAIVPAVREMHRQAAGIVRGETEWALSKLPDLTPGERRIVEMMASRIAGKLLHSPIELLKAQAAGGIEPDYHLAEEEVAELFYRELEEAGEEHDG